MYSEMFDFPTDWKDTRKAILRERSALLGAPKHYGKRTFQNRLATDEAILDRFSVVSLMPTGSPEKGLDYPHLWGDIAAQLEVTNGQVTTRFEFKEALALLTPRKKVLFMLRANGGNKKVCIQLLDTFQQFSHEHSVHFRKYYTVLVLDDLALYFHELNVRDQYSFWDFFQFKHRIPLFTDIVSVNEFLRSIPTYSIRTSALSNTILQLTGGHQGMIYKLLAFISEEQPDPDAFRKECREYLQNSSIIESIRQTLLKSPEHSALALSYKKRRLFKDIGPVMEDLFRAGIVLRADSINAVLCSGIVTDLVEAVYEANSSDKPGSPVHAPDESGNGHAHAQTVREVFYSYKHSVGRDLIFDLYRKVNESPGYRGIIDEKDLPFSESISAFAHRIGEGNFVVVAISDAYIRSVHCMFEFYELYRHSKLDAAIMMKKMLPIRMEEINLTDAKTREAYFKHWRETKDIWDNTILQNPDQLMSKTHEKVRNIFKNLTDMLDIMDDIKALSPELLTDSNFDLFLGTILSRKS